MEEAEDVPASPEDLVTLGDVLAAVDEYAGWVMGDAICHTRSNAVEQDLGWVTTNIGCLDIRLAGLGNSAGLFKTGNSCDRDEMDTPLSCDR